MFDDPLSERDVEDVIAGRQPPDGSGCGETAEWIARLRAVSMSTPPPPISPRLRAQLDRYGGPAMAPPIVSDDTLVLVGSDAAGRNEARSSTTPGYSRHRWRIAGVAAVGLMVVGAVTAVLLGTNQPTRDVDGPSQVVSERPDVDDTGLDDAEDLDASVDPPPKEPPPPAEPAPTTTDASDEQDSDAAHSRNPAGLLLPSQAQPQGMWSAWLDEYCDDIEESQERNRGGRSNRGGDASDWDVDWSELCEADFLR